MLIGLALGGFVAEHHVPVNQEFSGVKLLSHSLQCDIGTLSAGFDAPPLIQRESISFGNPDLGDFASPKI